MRLFIAIRISDAIIDKVVKIQEELNSPDLTIKWVEPYNMHVTLKFFGEVDASIEGTIENVMDAVCKKIKSFNIQFSGFGVFPNLQSPRVIWAGINEGHERLNEIAEKLNDTMTILNIPSEQWIYSGHLTIGRIKTGHGSDILLQRLRNIEEKALGSMHVACVELMESNLTPQGPEYKILKKSNLLP